jgi:CubicO group peptidase (beta-lactamase class C family)
MQPSEPPEQAVSGTVAPGYERLHEEFADIATSQSPATGAAFAAIVDGRVVADLWGGAVNAAGSPWQEDTLCVVLSGTKGIVATALLVLVDEGRLLLSDRVCDHWPEFADGGKSDITVAQLGSHAAGLPYVTEALSSAEQGNPAVLAAALARQTPVVPVGVPTYHALTWGWLCEGLIRHVTGAGAAELVHDRLAVRHGLDLRISLADEPEAAGRLARLQRAPAYRPSALAEDESDPRLEFVYATPFNLESEQWLGIPAPAVNGIATARALATTYSALLAGTVVGLDTLARGIETAAAGDDPLTGKPLRYGATGYELWETTSRLGPSRDAFGHSGSGGSTHGAWPQHRTGFSFVTSELRARREDDRAERLLDALHAAVRRA